LSTTTVSDLLDVSSVGRSGWWLIPVVMWICFYADCERSGKCMAENMAAAWLPLLLRKWVE
jgi:hypothetical protein